MRSVKFKTRGLAKYFVTSHVTLFLIAQLAKQITVDYLIIILERITGCSGVFSK